MAGVRDLRCGKATRGDQKKGDGRREGVRKKEGLAKLAWKRLLLYDLGLVDRHPMIFLLVPVTFVFLRWFELYGGNGIR